MNIEELREYCLAKPHTTEDFPFDESTLVFRVNQKMFALTSITSDQQQVNLKCDPERALLLREEYPDEIIAGYHMSKKHWNTVSYSLLPRDFVEELIHHSYSLVVNSFSKKVQKELGFIV